MGYRMLYKEFYNDSMKCNNCGEISLLDCYEMNGKIYCRECFQTELYKKFFKNSLINLRDFFEWKYPEWNTNNSNSIYHLIGLFHEEDIKNILDWLEEENLLQKG